MSTSRKRNVEWSTPDHPNNTWQHVEVEVLMDIRDELKKLNRLLHCTNFVGIPRTLAAIERNTTKKKRAP